MVGMPDYYAHQHSQNKGDHSGDSVVKLSSLYTVVGGSGGVEHATDGVELAVGNQLAAYVPPKRRAKDNPDKILCQQDDCKAFPMKTLDYCTGHARSRGLIENWKKAGRDDTG